MATAALAENTCHLLPARGRLLPVQVELAGGPRNRPVVDGCRSLEVRSLVVLMLDGQGLRRRHACNFDSGKAPCVHATPL
jgi:hypothetical protein